MNQRARSTLIVIGVAAAIVTVALCLQLARYQFYVHESARVAVFRFDRLTGSAEFCMPGNPEYGDWTPIGD